MIEWSVINTYSFAALMSSIIIIAIYFLIKGKK
jgi:hypothetical protein